MEKAKNKGGRPKGSYELANFIRASAKRAMEESDKDGKPLYLLLKEKLQENAMEFVRALASYTPKEIDLVDDREVNELTEAELNERIARLSARIEARLGGVDPREGSEGQDNGGAARPSELH